mmetsp:Transcript_35586/g.89362  ORF Transcript_35586/g.89362 Transcript_35586/m.89362 type:complete len:283 (+) Transcript_35586:231-1079(+)
MKGPWMPWVSTGRSKCLALEVEVLVAQVFHGTVRSDSQVSASKWRSARSSAERQMSCAHESRPNSQSAERMVSSNKCISSWAATGLLASVGVGVGASMLGATWLQSSSARAMSSSTLTCGGGAIACRPLRLSERSWSAECTTSCMSARLPARKPTRCGSASIDWAAPVACLRASVSCCRWPMRPDSVCWCWPSRAGEQEVDGSDVKFLQLCSDTEVSVGGGDWLDSLRPGRAGEGRELRRRCFLLLARESWQGSSPLVLVWGVFAIGLRLWEPGISFSFSIR